MHAADAEQAKHMAEKIAGFYTISDEKPELAPEIVARIT